MLLRFTTTYPRSVPVQTINVLLICYQRKLQYTGTVRPGGTMGKSDRDRPTKDSRVRGIAFHRAFEILFVGTYVHDQWEPLLCMLASFWPLRITFDMDLTWIILSALAFTSNIIPLLWQIEHRNSGPICLTFWVIVLNLNNFVSNTRCYLEALLLTRLTI